MHVFTAVITPGSRGTAYKRASRLIGRAASQGFDYWYVGGRFEDRLLTAGLLQPGDPWPEAIPITRLPRPLPLDLVPAALVTPRAGWLWAPLQGGRSNEGWRARVERLLSKYSPGHTLVLFDAHC